MEDVVSRYHRYVEIGVRDSMSFGILEIDNIYSSKTREYFREVLSSYSNGNYRSAVVMLYSVCICDLFYKLQELKDIYNDVAAKKILEETDKKRADSSINWEAEFIKMIRDETELMDQQAYLNMLHLRDNRNLSAHPSMDGGYELVSPSRETTIAHITNAVNDILSKPSIFIKSVFGMMINDLEEKKSYLMQDKMRLKSFLENKYFSRMPLPMKKKVFESLWKFSFFKKDDQHCLDNIEVNREALIILSGRLGDSIPDIIKGFNGQCVLAEEDRMKKSLIIYLSHFPTAYSALPDDTKDSLNHYISANKSIKYISWFLSSDIPKHLNGLLESTCDFHTMPREFADDFENSMIDNGYKKDLLDFYVEYYGKSPSYDDADERFAYSIRPHLSDFDAEQFKVLIKKSDENSQLYNRRNAYCANHMIFKKARAKLPVSFDYKQYSSFLKNEDWLQEE